MTMSCGHGLAALSLMSVAISLFGWWHDPAPVRAPSFYYTPLKWSYNKWLCVVDLAWLPFYRWVVPYHCLAQERYIKFLVSTSTVKEKRIPSAVISHSERLYIYFYCLWLLSTPSKKCSNSVSAGKDQRAALAGLHLASLFCLVVVMTHFIQVTLTSSVSVKEYCVKQ